MKNINKNVYIMLVASILLTIGVTYAWSNGPGVGYSTDPNHPNIGTHDLMVNSAINMLSVDMQNQIDITAADYGSEMPNYNETVCNCTYGIGDKTKHHVYYNSDGSVLDAIGADRAKAEYDLAMTNLSNGDKYNFSIHVGMMSHYITDVADYGHTMENESPDSNIEFEHYVNIHPDQFFNSTHIKFDGVYENITAYDATLALAKDTTFDDKFGDKTYTNVWMDKMMNNSSSPSYAFADVNFTNRTRQSINYSVNLLADVIYTMLLSNASNISVTPTPTPVVHYSSGSSSGGSSGSGGGGGGVSSAEPYNNILKYESQEEFIGLTPVTFRYSTPDIAIYEVVVTGNNSDDLTLRIEVLKDTSKLVGEPAPGVVYKNINIWANSKRIKNATIRYKVQNSWMDNNSVSASDIKMIRWDNSSKKWIELQTDMTRKDTLYTYFASDTDSLSGSFAISGIKRESVSVSDSPTSTLVSTEKVKQTENKPISSEKPKAPGFEIVLSIMSVLSIVYLFKKVRR